MPEYRFTAEYDVIYPFAEGGPFTATYGLDHEWDKAPDERWVPSDEAGWCVPAKPVAPEPEQAPDAEAEPVVSVFNHVFNHNPALD